MSEEKIVKSESFVSVVIILDRDVEETVTKIPEIEHYLQMRYSDFEVVVVAEKSVQSQATRLVSPLLQTVPCIRYLQLTNDVSKDVAREAGLENAIGDFIVLMSPKYDPIDLIGQSVAMCKAGSDVIVGISPLNHSLAYQMFRPAAQSLLKMADYGLPKDATHFRCLSRRAANAVTEAGKSHQRFFMRIQKSGYGFTLLNYEALCKEGRGFWHGLKKLLRLLVFNSQKPLRFMSAVGFMSAGIAFLLSLYAVGIKLFRYGVVDGWASTFFVMSMFAMLQFVILGFIGEYLARVLDEQGGQNSYTTVFEKNSLTMVDADRINVLDTSISTDPNHVQTARNN